MSSCSRVALVTGANKGIGFAITRDLCRRFSGDVVLTARDSARGRAAVQQLQAEGLRPRFHQLDIDDLQSIRALRDFLRKEYGGLDVLVNNAGIAFKGNDPTPFHIKAEVTMKTNFFGTRDVSTELLPLMKPQGVCAEGWPHGHGPLFAWLTFLSSTSPRDPFDTRQSGECVEHGESQSSEKLQPGAAAEVQKRHHQRGGAGGAHEQVRGRYSKRGAPEGGLAQQHVRRHKNWHHRPVQDPCQEPECTQERGQDPPECLLPRVGEN
uniref:Carbonyl reductase 1 n=1 Tax=Myotis myotis TaxID=51298 RepID=A0A7J7ZT00_MYOMY|nr:hypothetical protein mMyoMyo1_002144 [Myotis myotis]